jgi:hypothetical protein
MARTIRQEIEEIQIHGDSRHSVLTRLWTQISRMPPFLSDSPVTDLSAIKKNSFLWLLQNNSQLPREAQCLNSRCFIIVDERGHGIDGLNLLYKGRSDLGLM